MATAQCHKDCPSHYDDVLDLLLTEDAALDRGPPLASAGNAVLSCSGKITFGCRRWYTRLNECMVMSDGRVEPLRVLVVSIDACGTMDDSLGWPIGPTARLALPLAAASCLRRFFSRAWWPRRRAARARADRAPGRSRARGPCSTWRSQTGTRA